jgi:hypothetical protein
MQEEDCTEMACLRFACLVGLQSCLASMDGLLRVAETVEFDSCWIWRRSYLGQVGRWMA